jgi:transmembrane sensor
MDSERLARYLSGEASQDERAQVEAWARSDVAHEAELRRLRSLWPPLSSQPATSWNVDFAWTRVAGQLDAGTPPPVEVIPLRRSGAVNRWLAAAAVLIVAAGATWFALRPTATEYRTAVGERREIELPDGSHVMLAPASRLTLEPRYGQPTRALLLDGRAWFEVRHDPARPFRVRAREALIEDLGTEFEIDASGPEVSVAVISGSVSLTMGAAQPITLGPRDLGRVGPGPETEIAHEVAVERLITWRKGTLSFENQSLGQVLAELERWHQVTFEASAEVRARTFTGDLPTDNLDRALATLGTAIGLTARRTDLVIALSFKVAP